MNDVDRDELKELVKEALEEALYEDDEYSPLNRLNASVYRLMDTQQAEERFDIAVKNADKFEDYMKNVDKLNMMINEFKGLVSIVRGEVKAVQKQNDSIKKKIRKLLKDLSG